MDIEPITPDEIDEIISRTGFDYDLLVKDYYITVLLYLIRDIEGIYFKGGTALQLTLLDHARISEDIDFTLERPLKEVRRKIKGVVKDSKLFGEVTQDKDVDKFVRLIVPYKTGFGNDRIFIDLNERAELLTKPELFEMNHFYPNIPKFNFLCLSQKEMIAEKVAAAISRNKPRDHYDIYQIIKHKLPIDMKIVRDKCLRSGTDPSILRMFNKAKKLHNRWAEDMVPLLVEEVSFQEVMKTLAEHFNLKREKELLK
ncbi:MAG: nucleotidyl transferase AbiEii/AbiGii toxin family protein [Candidatus Heimdallarchaeota archaeon]|nr:nucleotidyl transferase AbiEii/AbiGii toxin family protein [Candidatus Heimdallarchaeota archaeon]